MRKIGYLFFLFLLLVACTSIPVRTQNPKDPKLTLPEKCFIEGIKIEQGQSFTDCVPVALETIFKFYSVNMDREEISNQIQKFEGTSVVDMIMFVIKQGLNIYYFVDGNEDKRWIKFYLSQGFPVIATVGEYKTGHLIILIGYDETKQIFFVADPGWRKIQEWRYFDFNEWQHQLHYGDEAFLVYSPSMFGQEISDYSEAVKINPAYALAYAVAYNRKALDYVIKGQLDQAISNFNKALEINPRLADTYNNRGVIYRDKGQYNQAISDFNKALEINSNYALAYKNLAWLLATAKVPGFRNGEKAVELALKACELSNWMTPEYLDTLAAAYARVGDFNNAIKWQEKAFESIKSANKSDFQERLNLYREHKSWPVD